MKGVLLLSNGICYYGELFGSKKFSQGEVVFQTGMVGYVESLSDPSYASQLLVLTYPIIGNYGVPNRDVVDKWNLKKNFESNKIHLSGLIVTEYSTEFSNWAASSPLEVWLEEEGIVGISGIDTRNLTKILRENGSMTGVIMPCDEIEKGFLTKTNPSYFVDPNLENLALKVSQATARLFNKGGKVKLCVIDCGIKYNQIRCLCQFGAEVNVVHMESKVNPMDYDGLFISNGPGNPEICQKTIEIIKIWLKTEKPIMGICLGHQLLALAIGCKTYKMKYGNRGHNQPCTHVPTKRCYMTSQNHGFAVDAKTIPTGWRELFYNENDNSNEGIIHNKKPFMSVQFHPEHMSGPMDTEFLLSLFVEHVLDLKNGLDNISLDERLTRSMFYQMNDHEKNLEALQECKPKKVLILGSGGLCIGQAGEFDYSGAQALKALKEECIQTVLVNPNIATVQTTTGMADKSYMVPITKEYVTDIIKMERPDGIYLSFGGQTGLNCGIELEECGVLKEYGVTVLGTTVKTIKWTEDRQEFANKMEEIEIKVAPSMAAYNLEEVLIAARKIGFPVMIRAAFALGGLGSGFAENEHDLMELAQGAFAHTRQILVDKSLVGWKEVEYEVVRDLYDNCITVCNMENIDPLGIHTGESVVVSPSQTLSNYEYNMLRTCALKVVRHLNIIGECNIQYALDPLSHNFYVIEVNARLSRSSALASKATGYPLAYVAAKLGIGISLPSLKNSVTGNLTTACFEPSLDYCIVKMPRWDLNKFSNVCTKISTQMKSVGEAMAIGRSFEEAFQKALRMVDEKNTGFSPHFETFTEEALSAPTDRRMLVLSNALKQRVSVKRIYELTKIDKWFLYKFAKIIKYLNKLEQLNFNELTDIILLGAKRLGFSDRQIAQACKCTELKIRNTRFSMKIRPIVHQIDTVAAEWPCSTNYLYLSYCGSKHDIDILSGFIMVLGSGVYRIGSSVEFDWCAVQCITELRKMKKQTIMVNCNPETVSTDYDMCDHLFFEELSLETVLDIYQIEQPDGIIVCMGGQLPNNIAMGLHREKVPIFGTNPVCIDNAENRFKFSRMLDSINISQPRWRELTDRESAIKFCKEEAGYPCLVRPSYVLSGAAMNVAFIERDLIDYLEQAVAVNKEHPVVISKFVEDAKELDVDGVAANGQLVRWAVSEHIENAGVHSGDATLVTPPQDLNEETLKKISYITKAVARELKVTGPFNLQLLAKDNNLLVIECNLRVSRSFPFVSKALGCNLIAVATRVILNREPIEECVFLRGQPNRVAVKSPVFSFSRLPGADVLLGVEMCSTGEVACFGVDRYEAFLKAHISQLVNGVIPPLNSRIMLSIGSYKHKKELVDSVQTLSKLGYQLFGSIGTAEFYREYGLDISSIDWTDHLSGNNDNEYSNEQSVACYISEKKIDVMINLPKRNSGLRRAATMDTQGYRNRRLAIEHGISLLTNVKIVKLWVTALSKWHSKARNGTLVDPVLDCITKQRVVRLPGLIDIHVHTRDPGQTHKENWSTVTRAALAGGITTILAMPNTDPAVTDAATLKLATERARTQSHVNYGLYLGATSTNHNLWINNSALINGAVGLKMYLNPTFNALEMRQFNDWRRHLANFPESRPICVHAEGQTLAAIILLADMTNRHIHICHVSSRQEIELIRDAKLKKINVTCEVAPHHLFLVNNDLSKNIGNVKPPLGTSDDCDALWENIDVIDCFASDHAPHTWREKQGDDSREVSAPPGYPGLETMLPLLLDAHNKGRITIDQIVEKMSTNPRRIFGLPEEQNDTWVEVDLNEFWTIGESVNFESKANWSPFTHLNVQGRVKRVMLNGMLAFVDGKVLVKPGFGKNVMESIRNLVVSVKTHRRNRLSSSHTTGFEEEREDIIEKVETGITVTDGVILPLAPTSPRLPELYHRDISGHHLLTVTKLDKASLNHILNVAHMFYVSQNQEAQHYRLACGKVLGLMFLEPSTRTMFSFAAAMQRLGGSVINYLEASSSAVKGESLEDTVRMLSAYSHVLVLRNSQRLIDSLESVSSCPLVSGGDGTGEHPTQALLDVFTIREEFGTVNNLTVCMVGDLLNGRTVHSLAKLLCLYNVRIRYVPFCEELQMPDKIVKYVDARGIFQEISSSLQEAVKDSDVVYMTRLQRERLPQQFKQYTEDELDKLILRHSITPELMQNAKEKMIVMHPLPRLSEINPAFDLDPRAAYFRQAEYGLYVRMALLASIMALPQRD